MREASKPTKRWDSLVLAYVGFTLAVTTSALYLLIVRLAIGAWRG